MPAPRPRHRRSPFPLLLAPLLAASAAAPGVARAGEAPSPAPALLAEALYLCDPLPPGGRDLNLAFAVEEGEPDPATGRSALVAMPRVQLALALSERLGLTADVGLAAGSSLGLDSPGASLKLLLRAPAEDRTGVAASLDLYGSTHSLAEAEVGVGLGAIRPLGPVTLRASASGASGVRSWSPHLHGGVSAAARLGSRMRALAEVVAEASPEGLAVSAAPGLKLALGEATSLLAGALLRLHPSPGLAGLTVQVGQGF